MSRPSGTNWIDEWAAWCARSGASFDEFSSGVDELMQDPSWVDAGWSRLLNAVQNGQDSQQVHGADRR